MNNWKKTIVELLKTIAISLVLVFILINFVLISVRVDGSSMYPTLHDGDFGFSFVLKKNLGIDRFDVVVVNNEDNANRLVKRVIGLPGETVEYVHNVLYINGVETAEPFLGEGVMTNDFKITLNDDEYFVMGDNREVSRDSRYYGPFNYEDFVASGVLVLWPLNDFGLK